MIPQALITAWRSTAPWADDAQVEQDLVLSRAVVEIFSESRLSGKLALRGGTCLNKLFVRPPVRYSEDIDLVQTKAEPIGPVLDAVRGRLDPWLGTPKRSSAKASATLLYRLESEIPPIQPMRLKVEINTREHFSSLGYREHRFIVENPWFTGEGRVTTYELDELMGTKLRALYQRRKGRDLFDLWLCLSRGLVEPARVIECFITYMKHGRQSASRAEFERNLHAKANDPAFLGDIAPLLVAGVDYDAGSALRAIREELIRRLPGEPWRGETRRRPGR